MVVERPADCDRNCGEGRIGERRRGEGTVPDTGRDPQERDGEIIQSSGVCVRGNKKIGYTEPQRWIDLHVSTERIDPARNGIAVRKESIMKPEYGNLITYVLANLMLFDIGAVIGGWIAGVIVAGVFLVFSLPSFLKTFFDIKYRPKESNTQGKEL